MVRQLPALLIAVRAGLGPLLYLTAHQKWPAGWFLLGLLLALASDVFDGIIARRLRVSSPGVRAADSWTDGWFCLWVAASLWSAHSGLLRPFLPLIGVFVLTDVLALLTDGLKYRRFAAYHAYSSRATGALLFLATVSLMAFGSTSLVGVALGVGVFNHLERLGMTLLLPHWTPDVPGLLHAWHLRNSVG